MLARVGSELEVLARVQECARACAGKRSLTQHFQTGSSGFAMYGSMNTGEAKMNALICDAVYLR